MIWIKRMGLLLCGVALSVILILGAGFIIGWPTVFERLAGPADLGPVTFSTLRKSGSPNQVLACPPDLCRNTQPDITSPVYGLDAATLKERVLAGLAEEPYLERVDDRSVPLDMRFVQRSKWFRFPDTLSISIIQIDETRSTLAIFSSSQIGQSDFGINRARIERILNRLRNAEVALS